MIEKIALIMLRSGVYHGEITAATGLSFDRLCKIILFASIVKADNLMELGQKLAESTDPNTIPYLLSFSKTFPEYSPRLTKKMFAELLLDKLSREELINLLEKLLDRPASLVVEY